MVAPPQSYGSTSYDRKGVESFPVGSLRMCKGEAWVLTSTTNGVPQWTPIKV